MNDIDKVKQYMEVGQIGLKQLTKNQSEQISKLKKSRAPYHRRLLGAPAGSGKSYLAVMLVADKIRRLVCDSFDETTNSIMLLTHSDALSCHLFNELLNELRKDEDEETMKKPDEMQKGCRRLQYHFVSVYVCTIDWLCTEVKKESAHSEDAMNAIPLPKTEHDLHNSFSLIVIDEAQHVFSYQPHPGLEGQHVYEENNLVRQNVDYCLLSQGHHQLFMFHDRAYQSPDGVLPVYPDYSNKKGDDQILNTIIRLPTSSRDGSVPFCRDRVDSKTGRVDIYPVHDDSVVGKLDLVDVQAPGMNIQSWIASGSYRERCVSSMDPLNLTEIEIDSLDAFYVDAIAKDLCKLQKRIGDDFWRFVAVLMPMPDMCTVWYHALIDKLRSNPNLAYALENARPHCSIDRMFFGPINNFSGLERPFIVTVGFNHPIFLQNNVTTFNVLNRVNSSIYQALTRCTYSLTIIDLDVERFMGHFEIRKMDHVGIVSFSQSTNNQFAAFVRNDDGSCYLRLCVNVGSFDEIQEDIHKSVTTVKFLKRPGNYDTMADESFMELEWGWSCLPKLRVLDFSHYLFRLLPTRSNHFLSMLSTAEFLISLDLSHCTLNEFPTAIIFLAQLENLNLMYNRITRLDARISNLKSLVRLIANNNNLNEIPPLDLPSLKLLSFHNNCLPTFDYVKPNLQNQLPKLERLHLNNNRIVTIATDFLSLTCLKHVSLEGNFISDADMAILNLNLGHRLFQHPAKNVKVDLLHRRFQRVFLNFFDSAESTYEPTASQNQKEFIDRWCVFEKIASCQQRRSEVRAIERTPLHAEAITDYCSRINDYHYISKKSAQKFMNLQKSKDSKEASRLKFNELRDSLMQESDIIAVCEIIQDNFKNDYVVIRLVE